MLLVYEGKDAESERIEANHYDADISNCSTDLNTSHDDSHIQCSSNDENDCGIGHEDETNMDHCLYEPELPARDSGNSEDIDKHEQDSKFLGTPRNRAVSPHSMDSWLNYSNSSDETSTQDIIVRRGTKLNLHDDEATQDTDDVDVYDKINFVNAKSMTSYKKSKIDEASSNETATAHHSNPFKFHSSTSIDASASKLAHDTDDGIEVGLEEEEDDDQLSSLSSNIDTIIVSESGETQFFNASGEQEEHPSIKKKKSTSAAEDNLPLTNGSVHGRASPMVDVRIIDFAHTTFTSKTPTDLSPNMGCKKVHHDGPDGGFLTGIVSLKRILSEFIAESI